MFYAGDIVVVISIASPNFIADVITERTCWQFLGIQVQKYLEDSVGRPGKVMSFIHKQIWFSCNLCVLLPLYVLPYEYKA